MSFEKICIQRFGADPVDMPRPVELDRMQASGHPFSRLMADVIGETIADRIGDDERPFVEAIERRRAALEEREDEIAYRDYGAASKYGEQTPEEMYEGVERSRSVGQMCRRSSKPYRACLMLLKLLRGTKSRNCLELGSGLGLTAAYQAAALEMNGSGTVMSLEGPQSIADIAEETANEIGYGRISIVAGRWQDTLSGVIAGHAPFDFAFIDGHHDRDASVGYFETILTGLADGAVFILDDIRWSDGMLEAWEAVRSHARVEVSIDLVDTGICWIADRVGKVESYALK